MTRFAWSRNFQSWLTRKSSDMCLKMCCMPFLTSSWSVKSTPLSSDFIFRNRNLTIWTPVSAENPWVNLEACGLAFSIWSTKSLKFISPSFVVHKTFPVDLRFSIIFNESIEVPLGRTETEYIFGLQVKLTISIVFLSVSFCRGSWGFLLPFAIQFFWELSASHLKQESSSTQ